MITKSTPEGARDYLVPSRLYKGKFYALPQSPQIYKQLLMIGGMDRYFQIARCFRDEDLRADRQPEFTQIDIEMSFASEEDIFAEVEKVMKEIFKQTKNITDLTFPRIKYVDAMDKYGSDKPDTRFGLHLIDVTDELKVTYTTLLVVLYMNCTTLIAAESSMSKDVIASAENSDSYILPSFEAFLQL